jgi:hypothetical protein
VATPSSKPASKRPEDLDLADIDQEQIVKRR